MVLVKAVVKPITDYGKDAIGGLYGAGAKKALEIGQRLTFDPQNKTKPLIEKSKEILNPLKRQEADMTDQNLAPTKQINRHKKRHQVMNLFTPEKM